MHEPSLDLLRRRARAATGFEVRRGRVRRRSGWSTALGDRSDRPRGHDLERARQIQRLARLPLDLPARCFRERARRDEDDGV